MKKLIFSLLIVTPVFFTSFIMAQEKKEERIPPGMEIQQIAGSRWLVPKGVLVHKEGDLIVFETANEYVARKLADMEERLAKIEAEQKKLNEKFEKSNEAKDANGNKAD
jgi:hypothetical protein